MTTPWGPGSDSNSSQPNAQPSPQQIIQQLGGFGIDTGNYGDPSGTGLDMGVPSAFRQQVDLALRRKLGARYQELNNDTIDQIATTLWSQTNGVAKAYFYQNPGPTSNQSLINQYLFSPASGLPDLARQMIGLLPANELTTADRRFLSSPGAMAGDVTQTVPMPFNPAFLSNITESFEQGDPGIDYGMPVGQPIATPVAGVIHIEYGQPGYGMQNAATQGWGRRVTVRTASGWTFGVGHLGPGVAVTEGEQVNPGQLLGVSGGDPNDPEGLGGYSSGPHVEIQWLNPQGQFTNPAQFMSAIYSGTTFMQLQSEIGGDLIGQGVVTTQAQQERLLGYDPLLDSIYGPIRNALEAYLGRRPLAAEIRQVAQLGLNSEQLKNYIDSLPSHIPGVSHGVFGALQNMSNTEFQNLFGYSIPDSMIKELYDKGMVTPSSMKLYLSQLPWGQVQDQHGVNSAYQASQPWMSGVWNDQPHPQDLHNMYNMAKQRGYTPPFDEDDAGRKRHSVVG